MAAILSESPGMETIVLSGGIIADEVRRKNDPMRPNFTSGDLKKYLSTVNKHAAVVTMLIDSQGGDFDEAIKIRDLMRAFTKERRSFFRGIVVGQVSSCANVIFQSCQDRIMAVGTEMYLHLGQRLFYAESDPKSGKFDRASIEARLDELEKRNEEIRAFTVKLLAARSGCSERRVAAFMEQESLLTPNVALGLNLIDSIQPAIKR